MYPKFWQFYARGVLIAILWLLPLWWINSILYLHKTNGIVGWIFNILNNIFILGHLVIDFICHLGPDCFTKTMSFKEVSFFAYFLTVLMLGFVIAIYKSWTWQENKN